MWGDVGRCGGDMLLPPVADQVGAQQRVRLSPHVGEPVAHVDARARDPDLGGVRVGDEVRVRVRVRARGSQYLVVGVGDPIRHRARDEAVREEVLARRRGAPHRVERHVVVGDDEAALADEGAGPAAAGWADTDKSVREARFIRARPIDLGGRHAETHRLPE